MTTAAADMTVQTEPERRHSRFGIAAFVMALLVTLAECMTLGLGGAYAATNPVAYDNPTSLIRVTVGLFLICELMLNVLSAALAIAGLAQRNRRRSLAAIGLTFSVLPLLCVVALIVVGQVSK